MINTKRWNDPRETNDGLRILVCRYRPRALPKKDETWDLWWKQLAPSRELHADLYGKNGPPIRWDEMERRYLQEMQEGQSQEAIHVLAEKHKAGETITLLCSSACTDPAKCHRSLLQRLIEARASKMA